jgi:hypothetical protein
MEPWQQRDSIFASSGGGSRPAPGREGTGEEDRPDRRRSTQPLEVEFDLLLLLGILCLEFLDELVLIVTIHQVGLSVIVVVGILPSRQSLAQRIVGNFRNHNCFPRKKSCSVRPSVGLFPPLGCGCTSAGIVEQHQKYDPDKDLRTKAKGLLWATTTTTRNKNIHE